MCVCVCVCAYVYVVWCVCVCVCVCMVYNNVCYILQGGKQAGKIQLYQCKLEEYEPEKRGGTCFLITPLDTHSSTLSLFNLSSNGVVFKAKSMY